MVRRRRDVREWERVKERSRLKSKKTSPTVRHGRYLSSPSRREVKHIQKRENWRGGDRLVDYRCKYCGHVTPIGLYGNNKCKNCGRPLVRS